MDSLENHDSIPKGRMVIAVGGSIQKNAVLTGTRSDKVHRTFPHLTIIDIVNQNDAIL
jgi:hypothetical protein